MNLKYNSSFLHEIPPQLSQYNVVFMEVVRVSEMQSGSEEKTTSSKGYKKFIVMVNQLGVRQEIRLINEDTLSEQKQIKVFPEGERVYKFKTFEGTNKKDKNRFKVQLVGYLTQTQSNQVEDEIDTRFYCHYMQLNGLDPMPEMANACRYKDFIFDFCFLNFPRTNDTSATDGSDYFKVVLMERDKVMTLNFVKNQISQGIDDGPYHQRLIISSIWNNKQYFLAGDVQKGVQLYEMDEKASKPKLIAEENMNMNVRQCVLFSQQNKNALRALITDEAKNVYAYSFTSTNTMSSSSTNNNNNNNQENNDGQSQQGTQEQQQNNSASAVSRTKISMELVASLYVGSKINKITTNSKSTDASLYDAASHLLLHRQDGNISIVQLIYEPGENTLLFDLQKTIFSELPYIGGLDCEELAETKLGSQSAKLKYSHTFFQMAIVDTYFNLTRPLQERIAAKLNRSREDFTQIIIQTILS